MLYLIYTQNYFLRRRIDEKIILKKHIASVAAFALRSRNLLPSLLAFLRNGGRVQVICTLAVACFRVVFRHHRTLVRKQTALSPSAPRKVASNHYKLGTLPSGHIFRHR